MLKPPVNVPDYNTCQPQPTLHTFAAGSLYLRMFTVFSAYSAVEIEEGLQANVSVMKELYIGPYCDNHIILDERAVYRSIL